MSPATWWATCVAWTRREFRKRAGADASICQSLDLDGSRPGMPTEGIPCCLMRCQLREEAASEQDSGAWTAGVLRGSVAGVVCLVILRDTARRKLGTCVLVSLLVLAGVWALAAQVPDSPADRAALEAVYRATGGPNWTNNTNWLSSQPLDSWHGVRTSDGRVVELNLIRNGLTGRIPRSLLRLERLQDLTLYGNQLTGPLPSWMGNLGPRLWRLLLGGNQLTGRIPSGWRRLTSLQRLELSGNRLTGPIPTWLGDLRHLGQLELFGNQFTGPIPPELGQASNLEILDLGYNRLSGRIPPALRRLTKLFYLNVSHNELTGPIPPGLGNLTSLHDLRLDGNQLTGRVPTTLRSLTSLQRLSLGPNRLTGRIPAWLADLPHLRYLTLGPNQWTPGPIPSTLQARRYFIQELVIDDSQLTGRIPAWLGQFPYLRILRLSGNRLTGRIPASFADLTRLTSLDLSSNRLTGRIPSLDSLTALSTLNLSANRLTGPIPRLRGLSESSPRVDLSDNRLTGRIPAWLGNLQGLGYLDLSSNRLSGPVPARLGNMANLRELYLDDNALTRSLPPRLTRLRLSRFWIHETAACLPASARFRAWVRKMSSFRGAFCGFVDRRGDVSVSLDWERTTARVGEDISHAYNLSAPLPRDVAIWTDVTPPSGDSYEGGPIDFPAGTTTRRFSTGYLQPRHVGDWAMRIKGERLPEGVVLGSPSSVTWSVVEAESARGLGDW